MVPHISKDNYGNSKWLTHLKLLIPLIRNKLSIEIGWIMDAKWSWASEKVGQETGKSAAEKLIQDLPVAVRDIIVMDKSFSYISYHMSLFQKSLSCQFEVAWTCGHSFCPIPVLSAFKLLLIAVDDWTQMI